MEKPVQSSKTEPLVKRVQRPSPLVISEALVGHINSQHLHHLDEAYECHNCPSTDCPTCSSSYDYEELISSELDLQLSPDIEGRCLNCMQDRPTMAAFPCGHLPFCEICAYEAIEQMNLSKEDTSFNIIKCPLCRRDCFLSRVYLPEDSGSQNGMCLKCSQAKANVVVMGCGHMSLCEHCIEGKTEVKCPICGHVGRPWKTFRPDL